MRLANLRQAFDDYVTWALGEGLDIPKPDREVGETSPQLATRKVLLKAAESAPGDAVKAELRASGDVAPSDIEQQPVRPPRNLR